ncbi:hypothetical protein [Bifidobacterium aesculapii]|uniref:hypothetical protein n=1 Tax=Bifidobacterium aesculapii TaxID=1329411 RepID=UPI0006E40127|nr:hypothetical protein [Bifidobacterium aesculapii]
MKAILWRDWRIFRTSPFCWGVSALCLMTMMLGAAAFSSLVLDGGNDFGVSDGLLIAMAYAPITGWFATYVTLRTLDANQSLGGDGAGDGNMESFRCSGRPMFTYCLAKSLLPMAVAETMILLFMAYLAWDGQMAAHGAMPIPAVAFALVAPPVAAFAIEEMLLASGGGTLGGTVLAKTVDLLVSPVLLYGFTFLCLRLPFVWALAAAIAFGLAMAALTAMLAHRRYPNTLRSCRQRRSSRETAYTGR